MSDSSKKKKFLVNKQLQAALLKDAELFEIFRASDGGPNLNLLLNRLFKNFYDRFKKDLLQNDKTIKKILKTNTRLDNNQIDSLAVAISSNLRLVSTKFEHLKNDQRINFNPHGDVEDIVSDIDNHPGLYSSMMEYYRQILTSYASLPRNQRELIIFKENYDEIQEAIKEKKMITIHFTNGQIKKVAPYKVAASNTELFNYLLCKEINENNETQLLSCRLNRIKSVSMEPENASLSENDIACLDQTIKCGPPYVIEELKDYRVQLTEKGKDLYKKIYLKRPSYKAIDGDYYIFDCSPRQLKEYFSKFGTEAFICDKDIATEMAEEYEAGAQHYRELLKDLD